MVRGVPGPTVVERSWQGMVTDRVGPVLGGHPSGGGRPRAARMTAMAGVVIIGGGPGGYESALVAAQLGAEVTVVDSDGLGRLRGAHRLRAEQDPDRHRRADDRRGGCRRARGQLPRQRGRRGHRAPGRPGPGEHPGQAARRRPVRRHRPPPRARGRARRAGPRTARRAGPGGRRRHDVRRRRGADRHRRRAPRRCPPRSPTASGSSPGSRSTTSPRCPSRWWSWARA